MQLDSDFKDYYDEVFNNKGIIFNRYSKTTLSKRDALKLLDNNGFVTPRHGLVENLCEQVKLEYNWFTDDEISYYHPGFIVYFDEYAHRGDGKAHFGYKFAKHNLANYYATTYIQTNFPKELAVSLRLLYIGSKSFWLKYTSKNIFSNVNGKVELLKENKEIIKGIRFLNPIYAIDFVPSDELYAIDFNTSPGLSGTGIENILKPMDVLNLIEEYYEKQ